MQITFKKQDFLFIAPMKYTSASRDILPEFARGPVSVYVNNYPDFFMRNVIANYLVEGGFLYYVGSSCNSTGETGAKI